MQFGVDWKLLVAQAVNFFILLVILKKFAYGPIVKMLDARRAKIEEGIAASEASKKKLAEAKEHEAIILLKANEKALSVVGEAEKEADMQARHILDAAHTKSEQVIASGQKRLEEERLELAADVQGNAENLIKLSLERVIGKLEPEERDRLLIAEALRELGNAAKIS